MIIKKLVIYFNNHTHKEYIFDNRVVIHSVQNSQGKTTLVKSILFAFGYDILPKAARSKILKIDLFLQRSDIELKITRIKNSVNVRCCEMTRGYSLPTGLEALHSHIFNTKNNYLIQNILGCFYIDQECGWIVFNRGNIAPRVKFNIDKIIVGLQDIDLILLKKSTDLKRQIELYESLLKLKEKQCDLFGIESTPENYHDIEDLYRLKNNYNLELSELKSELKKFNNMEKDNSRVLDYIGECKLNYELDDGTIIVIHKEKILGYSESSEYLKYQKKDISARVKKIKNEIDMLDKKIEIQSSDKDITKDLILNGGKVPYILDEKAIRSNLQILKDNYNLLINLVQNKQNEENVISSLNEYLDYFVTELGVSIFLPSNKIIDNRFSELSGTNKQLVLLSYRLAILKVVSKKLSIKLPIIIDSVNRETDKDNLNKMIHVIKDNFSEHQIILSTISEVSDPDFQVIDVKKDVLCGDVNDIHCLDEY